MFLGTTFLSGKYTISQPVAPIIPIKNISISDGTYDQLFVSKNTSSTVNSLDAEWNQDTVLNAPFEDSLDAGNSGFSLKNTDTIVIKRRELNTLNWITIYTKSITAVEDFDVYHQDKYGKSGVHYEYMLCSTINGIENSYVIKDAFSSFDGYYIVDKDNIYGTLFDIDGCDTVRNIPSEVVQLLKNKYPVVISNGNSNYDSGSVSGTFIKFNQESCTIDFNAGTDYRKDFMDYLCNKKPKILKFADGRIWLIKIVGQPSDSIKGQMNIRQISFSWVENGDVNDPKTLYNKGLSDVGMKWWY